MTKLVQHVLDAKQFDKVNTIAPNDTVQMAIEIMAAEKISSLPVMDSGVLVGIISERDYIRKAAPNRLLPWELRVEELMTSDVIHVTPDESIDSCMNIMTSKRIRHLPVLSGRDLVGIVSITDLIRIRNQ